MDDPNREFKQASWMAFVSGMSAGIADSIVNYIPYGLHYRLGRGENIRQWKVWRPRELYRGVLAYSSIIPVTCLADGMTDYLKSSGLRGDAASFISGAFAAMVISAPAGNAIVTDQRLAQMGHPAGLRNTINHLWKTHGMTGFYAGLTPLIMREGLYSWAVFHGKNQIMDHMECGDLLASAGAGTIAAVLSQPVDTLATFIQNKEVRPNVQQAIVEMYKQEGIKRFYRGFIFRWYAIVAGVYLMNNVSNTVKNHLSRLDEA